MSVAAYYDTRLPWSLPAEDVRRFRRIAWAVFVLFFIVGVLVPLLPLPEQPEEEVIEMPPRLARLMFEQRKPPPPPPRPKAEEPKPEPKKVKPEKAQKKKVERPEQKKPAKVDRREAARRKAEKSGLLAFRDELAELRENPSVERLKGARRLSSAGSQARRTERAILTSRVSKGSGGIDTSGLSRDTGGVALAERATTQVEAPVETRALAGEQRKARKAGRTIEEIQMVFDRNKGAIYALYNRALRRDPTLQGKLVLRLTIAPSGKVVACEVISSELGAPKLERKLVQRIKMFDFGARDVDEITITYPIDFLPA
ncbi:MAG TPA: AgmX/PglI C-terminal domain-containing protein [Thiotrichales bacterium]|nr:AgmX/PglI C-terminal domain-containing protein [Thiotrichales bacterium]